MEPVFIFLGVIILIVIIRLAAGGMDGDRIDEYIRSHGGQLIDKRWAPFGKGWFGSEKHRLYEISYYDADGNLHNATCKTNMWAGVYFTEDNIVQYAENQQDTYDEPDPDENPDAFVDSLIDENQRLREEIERLRGRSDS